MKWVCVLCVAMVLVFAAATVTPAKKKSTEPLNVEESPRTDAPLPPEIAGKLGGLQRAAAVADTFVLHSENFDDGTMAPYVGVDFTAQLGTFFHVADATELDGGSSGTLIPLSGMKSMWCGVAPTTAVPFCGWAALPGYGHDWDQVLESSVIPGDSLSLSYKIFWDSEPGYDRTTVEYRFDNSTPMWEWGYWRPFPINDYNVYDGKPPAPYVSDTFAVKSVGATNVRIRFHFRSDGAWSDEDGLWPTDGAVLVDDIAIAAWLDGVATFADSEDFESAAVGSYTSGIWAAKTGPAFGGPSTPAHPAYGTGQYAALYPGVMLVQDDPCSFVASFVVGFFDDPSRTNYACHIPDPRPDAGAVPYVSPDYVCIDNEVLSPVFANSGYGNEFRLEFRVYRDLPLDPLIFYYWRVRSWVNGCPSRWRNDNLVYYGAQKDWLRLSFSIGPRVTPNADAFQIAIGAVDMTCRWSCLEGCCHAQAPLIDDIRVIRVGTVGPQYVVRHIDGLFQDNFAQDGTLTGTARADCATDLLPATSVNSITPGDSVTMIITPIGKTGSFPNSHMYVRLQNSNHAPISGAALGSSAVRTVPQPEVGAPRFPFIATSVIGGNTWSIFRMDQAYTTPGGKVVDRYCVDLNDNLFAPGDTVLYFYAADADNTPNNGNEGYFTRSLDGRGANLVTTDIAQAAASPLEFTILPAGGYNNGGDILYVDDQDDRGGPGQLYFDSAFEMLGILDKVDRFDVLAPSSVVDNSLASRVKNNVTQIVDVYRTILWDSGELGSGTVGDGTGAPDKSNDWWLLYTFLNSGHLGSGPGLYLGGDDLASDWITLGGASAIQVRSAYMSFNLLASSHVFYGESVSPHLTAVGSSFIHAGVPDRFVGNGGCPSINDFDVLAPTGASLMEFQYPMSAKAAVISMQRLNSAAKTATVVLSGISYPTIVEAAPAFPPARVEFLRDILIKMGNVIGPATGIDPGDQPRYANVLHNNYPNPFNPVTTIRYGIKERGHVSLTIYNAAGQLVKTLVDEVQAPEAVQPVTWDGRNDAGQSVASGVYFYKLVTKNFSQTKKMVLLK